MTRRHPLVRVRHVAIRQGGRLRAKQLPSPSGPLQGGIDEPTPGERVPKAGFVVRGWSAWGDHPAVAVIVRANGVTVGRGVVGTERRPDVAEATGLPDLVGTGWRIDADLSEFEADHPIELAVVVWAAPEVPPVELGRCSVVPYDEEPPSDLMGALNIPRPGETVDQVFRLEGWVLHRSRPVEKIDVLLNGVWVQRARMGLVRPDLKMEHGDVPGAIISGFECWLDLTAAPQPATSPVKLQLVAWVGNAEPEVVIDRLVTVVPAAEQPERRGRDEVLAERRDRVRSSFVAPRPGALDLVVFTHELSYGGAQLWLDELLLKSGAGDRYACTVISPRDGPLREQLERRGSGCMSRTTPQSTTPTGTRAG